MERLYDGYKSDEDYGADDVETDLSHATTVPTQPDTALPEPWNDTSTKVDPSAPPIFQPLQLTSTPFVPFTPKAHKTVDASLLANPTSALSTTATLPRAAVSFNATASETSETSDIPTPSSNCSIHVDMAAGPVSKAATSATAPSVNANLSPTSDANIVRMISPYAIPTSSPDSAPTKTVSALPSPPWITASAVHAARRLAFPTSKKDSSPIARAPTDQEVSDILNFPSLTSGSESETPLSASQTKNQKKTSRKKKIKGKKRAQACVDEQKKMEQDQDRLLDELVSNQRSQQIQRAKDDRALVLRAAEEEKYDLGTATNEEKDAFVRCIACGDFLKEGKIIAGEEAGKKFKKRRPAKKAARDSVMAAERVATARFVEEQWKRDAGWTTRVTTVGQQNDDDTSFEALLPVTEEQGDIFRKKFAQCPARFPLDELNRLRKMRDAMFLRSGFPTEEFMRAWRALYLESQEKWPKDEGTFPYQEYSYVMELYFDKCQRRFEGLEEDFKKL